MYYFVPRPKKFSYGHIDYTKLDAESINELLDTKIILNEKNNLGMTAIMFAAAQANSVEIIQSMINKGADASIIDKNSNSAFMYACWFNPNIEIAQFLQNGIDNIDFVNTDGCSALMLACDDNSNPEIITFLINEGADINLKDNKGKTAYHYAKKNKKIRKSSVFQLLKHNKYSN